MAKKFDVSTLFSPPPSNYVETLEEDGTRVSKSPTSKMKYDPKTKKTEAEGAMINDNYEVKSETPKVETPPPVAAPAPKAAEPTGPYRPLAAQDPQTFASSETKTYKDNGESPQPVDTGSAWERALIGATPLLVGLLTGNELEGVQTASNYFTTEETDRYKRAKDFNGKLAELKHKRDLAATTKLTNKFGETEPFNPQTGKTEIWSTLNGKRYEFLGIKGSDPKTTKWQKSVALNEKTGKYEEKFVDPETGREYVSGQAQDKFKKDYDFVPALKDPANPTGNLETVVYEDGQYKGSAGELPPKAATTNEGGKNDRFREAQMNQALQKVASPNSIYNKAKESAESIVKAADLLNQNNPVANENIKTFIARSIFGEKGPLSDVDLARLAGSGALDAKGARLIQKWMTGDIEDGDANDLRQILEAIHPYMIQKAREEVNNIGAAYKVGGYVELQPRLDAYTKGGFKPLPAYTRQNAGKRVNVPKATPARPGFQPGVVKGGYRFKGGDAKKQENWEKVK